MTKSEKVEIENINSPGKTTNVDREKYEAMREGMLQVIPNSPPGLSAKEIKDGLILVVSNKLWPNGDKIGWWQKSNTARLGS